MGKILFVCEGNIGRSQMAEAYYNFKTKSNDAISAGIDPTTPPRYPHPSESIVLVMREKQIDVSKQQVKFLDKSIIEKQGRISRIYVLCDKTLWHRFLLTTDIIPLINVPIFFIPIDDPNKDRTIDQIRFIRDQICTIVDEIIKHS